MVGVFVTVKVLVEVPVLVEVAVGPERVAVGVGLAVAVDVKVKVDVPVKVKVGLLVGVLLLKIGLTGTAICRVHPENKAIKIEPVKKVGIKTCFKCFIRTHLNWDGDRPNNIA
jgi:hypothetical protein